MKILSAAVLAAALVATSPVQAQKLDLSTITCKQFIEYNKDSIGMILMWLTGYMADQDDPPVVDFDEMKSNAGKLGAYCAQNPTIGLMTAAEKIMGK